MASTETVITVCLVLYLTWAITLSNERYHGALSLCLFFFFQLLFGIWRSGLSDLGSLFISLPLLIAVGTICFFLSPFPALFHEARTPTTQSLDILADGEPGTVCIDIVPVHGLAANPASAWDFYSTKEHPESRTPAPDASEQPSSNTPPPKRHIWLRDSLPKEGLNARIMVYNHNTAWRANALNKSLSDYGDGLLHELRKVRKVWQYVRSMSYKQADIVIQDHHDRPIVFIGHSFGGLIVKQAIVNAHTDQEQEAYKGIIGNTKGFVFLGVPHKGTGLARLGLVLSMFGHWKGSRTNLLEVLRPDSELNASLHRAFMRILLQGCGIENTVCVFESVSETFMGLPITEVVNRRSAVIDGSQEIAHDQTHRSIQRSESSDDPQYKNLVHFLSEWAAEARNTANDIQEHISFIIKEKQKESFRSLAFDQMYQRQLDITKEDSETCSWISQNLTYETWQSRQKGLLWIKGKPGAGKSTILKYIVKQHQHPSQALVSSYFISGRGDPIQKTCSGVYRALLAQVFDQRPDLSSDFVSEYEKKSKVLGNQFPWHPTELENFLRRALLQASEKTVTHIFVDALDEAGDDEAVFLLKYFQSLARDAKGNLKVCVSSRHYPLTHIENDLEIVVETHNAEDIATFIRHQMDGQVEGSTKAEKIESEMITRAHGVFQWVALVLPRVIKSCRYGSTLVKLAKDIQDTPQELDSLYHSLFADATDSEKEMIVRLMRWACFSIKPLSLAGMRHAMAIDFLSDTFSIHSLEQSENYKDSDDGMRRWATDLSRGLVDYVLESEADLGIKTYTSSHVAENQVEQWLIQPNHQTVQDFVTKGGLNFLESSPIVDSIGMAHHYIYRSCLRYLAAREILAWLSECLSQVYVQDDEPLLKIEDRMFPCSFSGKIWQRTWNQTSPGGQLKSKLQSAAGFSSFPFIDYALEWVQHAQKLESLDSRDNMRDLVNLLYWDSSYLTYNVWTVLMFRRKQLPMPFLHFLARSALAVATNELLKDARLSDHNLLDHVGDTALSVAAGYSNQTIVRSMLQTGKFDLETRNRYGETPLSHAAKSWDEPSGTIQVLLSEGNACIELKDENLRTPLSFAAERGHDKAVKLLLEHNADPNLKDKFSKTPLLYAAADGHEDVVRLLLAAKIDPDSKSKYSRTPLSYAAQKGHEGVVKLLLEAQADPNSKCNDSRTPLSYAAENKHEGIAKLLLESKRVSTAALDSDGMSSLHYALSPGKRAWRRAEPVVQILVEAGADMNIRDHNGKTALHYALHLGVQEETESVLRVLLDAGADIKTLDDQGKTALHHALSPEAGEGKWIEPVVQLLLGAGADINSQDHDGETALHYALHLETDDKTESVVRVLLEAGAKFDSQDAKGKTALHHAISYTKSEAVGPILSVLLDFGASLEIKDNRGYTPLILAARKCSNRRIEALLHHGVDQDTRTPFGRTALFYILGCSFTEQELRRGGTSSMVEAIQSLVKSGLDMNHRDKYGRTALSYAIEFASAYPSLEDIYQPVVDILREQGAEDFGDIGVGMDTEDGRPFKASNSADEYSDENNNEESDEDGESDEDEDDEEDQKKAEVEKDIPSEGFVLESSKSNDENEEGIWKFGEEDKSEEVHVDTNETIREEDSEMKVRRKDVKEEGENSDLF